MRKVLFFALSMLSPSLFAQTEKIPVDLVPIQLNVNLLPLTAGIEARLGDVHSFSLDAGLAYALYFTTETITVSDDDFDSFYSINPLVIGNFRQYYSRKRVKKELKPNSGNFVALYASYLGSSISDNVEFPFINDVEESFAIGPVWGIQRNYQSGIHLLLSIGVGYTSGQNIDPTINFIGQFEFGFAIFQKEK